MHGTVIIFLKMTSFHHVMHDNRYLMRRIDQLKKEKETVEDLPHHFDISPEIFEVAN